MGGNDDEAERKVGLLVAIAQPEMRLPWPRPRPWLNLAAFQNDRHRIIAALGVSASNLIFAGGSSTMQSCNIQIILSRILFD